ncbi:hypothetical protein V9T40_006464 [Parthenolecanium corni]|uniref:Uncharacterized protein n=1 Tax=Parthenolecanium corni TaxID=536013 RepID=A0AAN9TMB5_9HEMI
MSDDDKSSSSESEKDSSLPESVNSKRVVNPIQKFCFFLNEAGRSLNFVLLADTMTDSEVTEATQLIELHLGTVSTNKKDVSSYCAVLVADEATTWDYFGDVFKLSYIHDCVEAGKILDIAVYLKDPPSKLYVDSFDYMFVIYDKKFSWETIPSEYKLPSLTEHHPKLPPKDTDDSDSSVDSFASIRSVSLPSDKTKQTKSQYSHDEKEAMLRYVVERKMYHRVKGKKLYKEMEAANVSI